ncbi:thiamin pyrophosphokinase [Prevotella intermedia]|uniref:Thiamine diphosphokinase n=1 Tax=Prevotella intermedia TaxID=28131 RepID=A0AAD1BIA9_PREIN|nr:thiamine diphosphokinase [Prevotella intermedia]AFJ08246.1 thiamine diphosphokinase [Prevotella intermedia 17]APW34725.1 thiamine pyrophosphokinase [Prevotella intermedia]BAR95551.1 thiamin pyrophosphokinase [Prevotella intermedia]
MKERKTEYDVVILAAGDFPTDVTAMRILRNAKHLIACDRAVEELLEMDIEPEVIVGDGDSVSATTKAKYQHIFHTIDEQEDNDLTKATKYALQHFNLSGTPTFCYLGATGKREDHTLGNIALLIHYYKQLNIVPTMVTNYGWFTVSQGKTTFATFPKQQVSIFQIGCKRIESKGLKWNIYPFNELWQGTLNEAVGNSFTIDSDSAYLVYQTHKPKE